MDIFAWVVANAANFLTIATYVVSAAAVITAMTPSPKDDGFVSTVRSVLDKLALNVGHAKNADPK